MDEDVKIVVTNTAYHINNYSLGDSDRLEGAFSIWDPITHKLNPFAMYYDENEKRLYIPRGVDLWWLKGCFENPSDKTSRVSPPHRYKRIENINMNFKPRDEEQIQALKFMCGVQEFKEYSDAAQLSVNLNTGKGKTYCSIATIAFHKIKSIIITGSDTLLNQWKTEILKYTNLKDQQVYRINGSDNIKLILSGNSNKANNADIFLCTHGTLKSFGDTFGWDKIYDLFKVLGIGLKFYDEAHTNFNNLVQVDFFTNTYKTYYVTATPGRSNFRENKIFQRALNHIPNIDLFDEDKDPHTSYIAIKYNSKPTPLDISRCKNQYGLDRMKYIDYISKNPEFYKALRVIMELVLKCKGRVLFYIGTNDAILRVYHWMSTNYPELLGDIGIFSSLVDHDQKMVERDKKILLSTTKSAGLGEHIEGLKMTVLLAEPFKSEILARQTLGRTRDDNTMYIELVDLGFKYTRNFYYSKLKTFNKYAKDVSDTMMDIYELNKRSQDIIENRTSDWRICPFEFADDRFNFDEIVPKKEEERPGIIEPIKFVAKNKYNNVKKF